MLLSLAKQALLGMVRSRSFSICQRPAHKPHETAARLWAHPLHPGDTLTQEGTPQVGFSPRSGESLCSSLQG